MHKKVSVGALITAVILAMALTVSVTMLIAIRYFNTTVSDVTQRQTMQGYLTDMDKTVRYHYIGTVDEEKLRQALGEGYVKGTGDPYAAYLPAEAYRLSQDAQKGQQTGFGLEVALSPAGRITVARVHADSTADKAGLQWGDIVTAVNGSEVSASDFASVSRTLAQASKVLLSVSRQGQTLAFEISTSTFETVNAAGQMMGENVGYIRLYAIQSNTPVQFRQAYERLEQEGADRFIFDVRGCREGTPEAVEELLDYLAPAGAYARQVDRSGKSVYLSSESDHALIYPAVVLTDADTAGEAELFAGVLRELEKAAVVGDVTAGKGWIQEDFGGADGAMIRLSVAERQLIKGGAIEGVGIQPDEQARLIGQLALTAPQDDLPLRQALRRVQAMTGKGLATTAPAVTATTTAGVAVDPTKTVPAPTAAS
ncbi:MAG: S41 family peptidase [Acutalibacteraceae bacterium]|jgi:carboxyl-terminal processing protease